MGTILRLKIIIFSIMTLLSGALCAYTAWSVSTPLVVCASSLFFVFLLATKRNTLFWFSLGYHGALSRGLLASVAYYYHSVMAAIVIWALFVTVATGLYVLFWHRDFKRRLLHFPILVAVLTLPPVGLIYAANPLTAAGIVFPGFGLTGVPLYLLSIMFVSALLYKTRRRYLRVFAVIIILFATASVWKESKGFTHYVQTTVSRFHYTPVAMSRKEKHAIARQLITKSNRLNAKRILFFENALGDFEPADYRIWHENLDGDKKVYAGAHIYDKDRKHYDNVLMTLTSKGYTTLYKQRIPMPISMWKPFAEEGANLHLFSNTVVTDEGKKIGVLICYEQLLALPVLQTLMHKPSMLFAVSNLWWSRDDTFLDAQRFSLIAWASLMGIPLYYAFNVQ